MARKFLAFVVFIALCGWFYFTPYIAFNGMKSAIEAKNAAKMSDYINYPALKENVKASISAKFIPDIAQGKDKNPAGAFGAALAVAFIGPMVDALITPAGLERMMLGDQSQPVGNTAQQDADLDTSKHYESFDRFVVSMKKKGSTEEPFVLVFIRDGMISWKLSALRLPK